MSTVFVNLFGLSLAISLSLVVDIATYAGVETSTQTVIIESSLQESEVITPVADLSAIAN